MGAAEADLLDDVTRMAPGRLQRASSGLFDPESNADCHHVYPGQRLLLADLEGPGEIRHMWFTLASADRRYPRNVVLRAFWDGSEVPAIESPIGDFFGAGNGMRANIDSIPVSVSSYGRALNCYWRMPFRERAVIEVENQGHERVSVYFQCEWLALDRRPDDALYFHARYRQEYPAKPLSPYVVFEGQGEGQYVGTVYSSQNMVGSWFGEADDRFYIDGETTPSIVGTGTEDYFNDAWNLRVHTHQRRGVSICETKGDERRITAYRWHLDDPVTFHRSLRVEMERRSFVAIADPQTGQVEQHDFKYRPDYVSSVAFWYQRGNAPRLWDLPPASERVLPEIWIEPTRLVDVARAAPGLRPRVASNRTCNLKQFFYMRNDGLGGWVELPFVVGDPGRYAVSIIQNLNYQHGVWRVSLLGPEGEVVMAPALDFWDYLMAREENWPENYHHGTTIEAKLGEWNLAAGEYSIRFECVGANPLTRHPETQAFGQGFSLGLDAINLRRLPIDPAKWLAGYLPEEERLFAEREREARETVDALVDAVEAYRSEHGRYPASLTDLLDDPAYGSRNFTTWSQLPLDPWGQPYQYRRAGMLNPWSFDVWSAHGDMRAAEMWIGNWATPFSLADAAPAGSVICEGEAMEPVAASPGARSSVQRLTALADGCLSGSAIRFISSGGPGEWMEFPLPVDGPSGEYDAYVLAATSWDYGTVRWSLGDAVLAESMDAYSPRVGQAISGPVRVRLDGRPLRLRMDVIGKSERSAGFVVGLDALILVPR